MTASKDLLGPVLVSFSRDGAFPLDEITSAMYPEKSAFSEAMVALSSAKSELETEVINISRESAPDVDGWISHIKSIQEDTKTSRKLANRIVKFAEEDEQRLQELDEQQKYASFLTKELNFNQDLSNILRKVNNVYGHLVKVEYFVAEHQPTDALDSLDGAYQFYQVVLQDHKIPTIQALDLKFLDVRKRIHEELLNIWRQIVHVDPNNHAITVLKQIPNKNIGIDEVVTGLSYFGDVENVSEQLSTDLFNLIIKPRTSYKNKALPSIQVREYSITLGPLVDHSIQLLFDEIEDLANLLIKALPPRVTGPLSKALMPQLSELIFQGWLDRAVASSPAEMFEYEKILAQVTEFAANMDNAHFGGVDSFRDWVDNAPKIWLNKRQETILEWTRDQISLGLGTPIIVERLETRIFQTNERLAEDQEITTTVRQEWDAAWDGDEEIATETHTNQPLISNDQQKASNLSEDPTPSPTSSSQNNLKDDDVDAWGWSDEDEEDLLSGKAQPTKVDAIPNLELEDSSTIHKADLSHREVSFSEKYWITKLPQSTLKAVTDTYEESIALSSSHKKNTITAVTPRLLNLPTQILAMYRATSPDCYAEHPAGNMYRYNDSLWLAKMLKDFASNWKQKTDIPKQLIGLHKLDADIPVIESFGKRAYGNELNVQRMGINSLLRGNQNFFRREDVTQTKIRNDIQTVILHIRGLGTMWEKILPYSAWASATGSMVNIVAVKLINDVLDLPDIGIDEAERIATIISEVETLDDLFIRRGDDMDQSGIPVTAQFADKWMKMKFLSEVLQSNLKDIRFLWFESDLSLYFTADEIVELIRLSFEMNSSAKQVIKEITENPKPKGEDGLA